jgi:hypothetical protein
MVLLEAGRSAFERAGITFSRLRRSQTVRPGDTAGYHLRSMLSELYTTYLPGAAGDVGDRRNFGASVWCLTQPQLDQSPGGQRTGSVNRLRGLCGHTSGFLGDPSLSPIHSFVRTTCAEGARKRTKTPTTFVTVGYTINNAS